MSVSLNGANRQPTCTLFIPPVSTLSRTSRIDVCIFVSLGNFDAYRRWRDGNNARRVAFL